MAGEVLVIAHKANTRPSWARKVPRRTLWKFAIQHLTAQVCNCGGGDSEHGWAPDSPPRGLGGAGQHF